MAEDPGGSPARTYLNPVYPRSFPDPFLLKFCGDYYAYCTDFSADGNVFGVLHSKNLVDWTETGGAMAPLENGPPFYWAPEVTYANGRFYLYYSCGNEKLMEIRVAVSGRPDGGFVDCGRRLTSEEFAIDAHVFTDADGSRFLFYATDFLEHTHIGTGTVVDRMIDLQTLAGNPSVVTRAKYDWQIYDPIRKEKGGVRWHTVEGPFVIERKGVYYEMFSGGNWQNPSYGVSFATSDRILNADEWDQFSDGDNLLPILRTIENSVIGPGHNCAVRGPNNRELYCVYHRWTDAGRVMAIDRMDFAGRRIFIEGPTTSPQPAPWKPTIAGFSGGNDWVETGVWKLSDETASAESTGSESALKIQTSEYFLCEVTFRASEANDTGSVAGFRLMNAGDPIFEFAVYPLDRIAALSWKEKNRAVEKRLVLPGDFSSSAFHLLRIDCNSGRVQVSLNEADARFEARLDRAPDSFVLTANRLNAEFASFELTEGFEDLFENGDPDPARHGWLRLGEGGSCRVENGELILDSGGSGRLIFVKGGFRENFEFAANLRLVRAGGDVSSIGFVLLQDDGERAIDFSIDGPSHTLKVLNGIEETAVALPDSYDPAIHHQLRILKTGPLLLFQMEGKTLWEYSDQHGASQIGLLCSNAAAAFEMVRWTVL